MKIFVTLKGVYSNIVVHMAKVSFRRNNIFIVCHRIENGFSVGFRPNLELEIKSNG